VTVMIYESAQLQAVAGILESWAGEVPMAPSGMVERWDAFAARHYAAEEALEARLRDLPGCELWTDVSRSTVRLKLAGINVLSHACLCGACRAWAAEARLRVKQQQGGCLALSSVSTASKDPS
jgi:hypothetical protein